MFHCCEIDLPIICGLWGQGLIMLCTMPAVTSSLWFWGKGWSCCALCLLSPLVFGFGGRGWSCSALCLLSPYMIVHSLRLAVNQSIYWLWDLGGLWEGPVHTRYELSPVLGKHLLCFLELAFLVGKYDQLPVRAFNLFSISLPHIPGSFAPWFSSDTYLFCFITMDI